MNTSALAHERARDLAALGRRTSSAIDFLPREVRIQQ